MFHMKRALTPCRYPSCRALLAEPGYCDKHRRDTQRAVDVRRGSSTARGYGYRWQQYRAAWLLEHPLCGDRVNGRSAAHSRCAREGRIVAGRQVDHIQAHRGDELLMWSASNHQTLCDSCHSSKTAREDGAFGNNSSRGGGQNSGSRRA
jgi:5-methylcytosine-specific restriction protein A